MALTHGYYDIEVNSERAVDIVSQINPRKMELEGVLWCSLDLGHPIMTMLLQFRQKM